MNKLKLFWDSIRSNTYFVAFEGGASGALVNYIYDGLTTGKLDFSRAGIGKMLAFAVTGGVTAVRLLVRPSPTPTIVATIPPSQVVQDVPAKLAPVDPAAVPVAPTPINKPVAMILIALMLLPLTACNSVSTSTPTAPAVTALDVLNQVQGDVLAVQSAEIAAVNAGLIDQATNAAIQKALKQEAVDATAVATAISSAATTATVQAKVDALLADLQTDVLNGALGIKDAKTRATVVASISVAEIAVNGIMAAYNAGK